MDSYISLTERLAGRRVEQSLAPHVGQPPRLPIFSIKDSYCPIFFQPEKHGGTVIISFNAHARVVVELRQLVRVLAEQPRLDPTRQDRDLLSRLRVEYCQHGK